MKLMLFCVSVIYFLLFPGILISIPPKGSILTKALVHTFIFMILYILVQSAFDISVEHFKPSFMQKVKNSFKESPCTYNKELFDICSRPCDCKAGLKCRCGGNSCVAGQKKMCFDN